MSFTKAGAAPTLSAPSHARILSITWPIVVANATVPLLGLSDTAVIGHLGSVADLGAIALGALIFNFVYWGFGFLRMGTSGFVARAAGAGDEAEVRAALGRALLMALVLGLGLIAAQRLILWTSMSLLSASDAVEATAGDYFLVRIWGAPASLCLFGLTGCLVGLGESRKLLRIQLFLNGLNIALDLSFAGLLKLGAEGIALGTVLSEWTSLLFALVVIRPLLLKRRNDGEAFWPLQRIRNMKRLADTALANVDILIRTLLLVSSFAWFTNQSAEFGDVVLGANHLLLQLISFCAYFLDGYAFTAESLIGRAIGAGRRDVFDAAVLRSTALSGATALLLALAILCLGKSMLYGLSNHADVVAFAAKYLPHTAAYIALSFAAFQLDGIFIGASRTRALRNAALLSTLAFLGCWLSLRSYGYAGLWFAFIAFVLARALCLGAFYPSLRRSIAPSTVVV